MKQKKQCLAALLAAVILSGSMAGCGSGAPQPANSEAGKTVEEGTASTATENFNATGFPIVNEPITLNIMAVRSASFQNGYAEMEMFKNYEEETGIKIQWDEVAEEGWAEKTKLTLAAGSNLPDAFYGATIDGATVFKYGQQNIIRPIEDLIENYSTNAKKWLAEREDIKKIITYTDGHIYSLPSIDESLSTRIPGLMMVNQTWLDRVGLKAPTTPDEYYNMLKTFKEKDANGNGTPGDEICLSVRQYSTPNTIDANKSLTNLFGMFGVVDDNSHVMVQDDKVMYVPTSDGYRKGVEFFNKLYKEGLFDQESFTQNDSQFWSKSRSAEGIGTTQAFAYLELNDGNVDQNNYVIMNPMEGQVVCKPVIVAGLAVNRFTITSSNKYPEATMRWIDTFLDNGERALESRFGKQGETWQWLDDEKSKFTEMATSPDGNKVDTAYISQFGPAYVSVQWELEDLWRKKQNTIQQFIDRAKACNEVYINHAAQTWPGLSFDEDTNREFTNIDTDLRKYTDNMLSKFIMEGVDDASWNEYVQKCEQLKSKELVEIYQKRWDSYLNS